MKFLGLVIAAVALCTAEGWIYHKEDCGCCWPPPPDCCSEPPEPPTTPPPPPPACSCLVEVVFIVDRTGSVGGLELKSIKNYINRVMDEFIARGLEGCVRHALLSFSKKTMVDYAMGTEDLTSAQVLVENIRRPRGDTNTHIAFAEAANQFLNDPNPTEGACKVIVLLTDGGSEDKDALQAAVQATAAQTDARLCIANLDDPDSTPTQIFNRASEFNMLTTTWEANSSGGSSIVLTHDFKATNAPDELVKAMVDCVCDCGGGDDDGGAGGGDDGVLESTERFLCKNAFHEHEYITLNGEYVKGTCQAVYKRGCRCKEDPNNARNVIHDPAKPDCRSGECSTRGCRIDGDGNVVEEETTSFARPDFVCENLIGR